MTFARTAAHDLEDKLRRFGEQDERYREIRARTLHAYAFGVLGGEGFLRASDRVPRIALEFERDFLLQDLQGALRWIRVWANVTTLWGHLRHSVNVTSAVPG